MSVAKSVFTFSKSSCILLNSVSPTGFFFSRPDIVSLIFESSSRTVTKSESVAVPFSFPPPFFIFSSNILRAFDMRSIFLLKTAIFFENSCMVSLFCIISSLSVSVRSSMLLNVSWVFLISFNESASSRLWIMSMFFFIFSNTPSRLSIFFSRSSSIIFLLFLNSLNSSMRLSIFSSFPLESDLSNIIKTTKSCDTICCLRLYLIVITCYIYLLLKAILSSHMNHETSTRTMSPPCHSILCVISKMPRPYK